MLSALVAIQSMICKVNCMLNRRKDSVLTSHFLLLHDMGGKMHTAHLICVSMLACLCGERDSAERWDSAELDLRDYVSVLHFYGQ